MAKITNPVLFTKHFNIDPKVLDELGVFNPLLNGDTHLFIDPLLIQGSIHREMNVGAIQTYRAFFTTVISLLAASKTKNDVAWRAAKRQFVFPEVQGTCIGYGASSIHGSAWSPRLSERVLAVAKEIVDLGIKDPDLFLVLALFEEGIGPDRISDMVTNIIIKDLIDFNNRILIELSLPLESFILNRIQVNLPRNPFESKPTPIILIPKDIMRDLPIARDWNEVCHAAWENEDLRRRVSEHVGSIWEAKTRADKDLIKSRALASNDSFMSLLDAVHAAEDIPYSFTVDKKGEVTWMHVLGDQIAVTEPLSLSLKKSPSIDDVFDVAKKIVEHYKSLIENKGLWKELWADGKPRPEKSAQRIFFAIADVYCKFNGIDLTPEADSGNGPVDFKFSFGYESRVLVEVKLSTNNKLVSGYEAQLEAYKAAEETFRAIYLVIDVGKMGNKDEKLIDTKNSYVNLQFPVSDIIFVDGKQQVSASKRK